LEIKQATLPEEITSELGGTYFLKGRWSLNAHARKGRRERQVPFVLADPPPMKLWSFDARSKGQPGYSLAGEVDDL
jgi:hypothetical protein